MKGSLILGIIFLILGFVMIHFVRRKRFYRRNAAGLQTYKSYKRSVIIPFFEKIVHFFGYCFVAVGVMIIFCMSVMMLGNYTK